ncbi:hypothetical protein PanWU01x14_054380 [Parasponia andersonii]|uniref:Uncharacterized protein n=1 Tax=Parasponia andersonii TaxID=3476 RepID=A0A2P5DKV5_PARAD|nr:hypothetical protein PanWU01x14_054380 [Parasponia andersonii]
MAIPLDEELSVFMILNPMNVPSRREKVIPNDQIKPLLLCQIPHRLLPLCHHQIVPESVVMSRLHAPGYEPHQRRGRSLSQDLHRPTGDYVDRTQHPTLHQVANRAGRVFDFGDFSSDLRHLRDRIVEERLNLLRPGPGIRGRAWGFEGGLEPGVEDFNGGFGRGRHAGDGEDVGVVDRAGVEGLGGVEARGGEDAGELVGEDGDADARAAGDEATCLDGGVGVVGGGGGDAATDLGGD